MNSLEIKKLIQMISKLPGLGPRSGKRVALHLLKKKEQVLLPFIDSLKEVAVKITTCQKCFNFDTSDPCSICTNPKRDHEILCVVENVEDLWALERSNVFRGIYHVLGGVLSAIDGFGPAQLTIKQLEDKISLGGITEVILALNPTLDGQTTMFYLMDILKKYPLKITTLAQGIPLGGELDYLDDGTLTTAFVGRKAV